MSASVTCDGCGKVDRVDAQWLTLTVNHWGVPSIKKLAGDYCSPDCLTSALERYREQVAKDRAEFERWYSTMDAPGTASA